MDSEGSGPVRPMLDVTVVIPTLGRPMLEQCLSSIAAGTAWPSRLLVVDQSSSQAVAHWVDRLRESGLPAEHIPSSQRGKAAALNRGLERVTTTFVAVTDDDCLVRKDWLETMRRHLGSHPDAVVTGPAHAVGEQAPVAVVTVSAPRVSTRPSFQFDLFCGSNMGVAMATVRTAGGFDEHPCFAGAAEDCEWAYRVLRMGIPIVYAPGLIVDHVGWRGAEARYERYRGYARSHGSFYGKYLRRGDLRIAVRVVLHHLRALKRWGTGVVTGNRDQRLNGRAYLTGLLPGIVEGIRRGA